MIIKKSENQANNLLESLGINIDNLPIPIFEIAEKCKVKIKPYNLGDDISGVLVINKGEGTIGVNPLHPKVRQRFTVAHELGHYLLHVNKKKDLFVDKGFKVHFRDQQSSFGVIKKEQEANAFAAAILMPENLLQQKIAELDLDLADESAIKYLAQLFDVSPLAMTIRISNLRMTFL